MLKHSYIVGLVLGLALGSPMISNANTSLQEIGQFKPEVDFGPQNIGSWKNVTRITKPLLTNNKSEVFICAQADKRTKCYSLKSNGSVSWAYPSQTQEFSSEYFENPVLLKDGTIVLTTTFGKILQLNSRTGETTLTAEISDPNGTLDVNKNGPFEKPSVSQDGETVIIPSNSGSVFFVSKGKLKKTIVIECSKESSSEQVCYFGSPILTRNDGAMAVYERSRIVYLTPAGQVSSIDQVGSPANLALSEKGDAFVVTHDEVVNDPKDSKKYERKSRIKISAVGKPTVVYQVDETSVTHTTQISDGTIVFTASDRSQYPKEKYLVGIIRPGDRDPKFVQVAEATDSLYTAPTVDKDGRIYVVDLDGGLFALDSNGVLQNTVAGAGESRESPVIMDDGVVVSFLEGMLYEGNTVIRFFKLGATNSNETATNANVEALNLLTRYESSGPEAMGMCDGMRSTLIQYKSSSDFVEMLTLIPAQNSQIRFTVVKKQDTNEFFISRFRNATRTVQKLDGPTWTSELLPMSSSFFNFVFFKDKPNDCTLGKVGK